MAKICNNCGRVQCICEAPLINADIEVKIAIKDNKIHADFYKEGKVVHIVRRDFGSSVFSVDTLLNEIIRTLRRSLNEWRKIDV